MSPAENRAWLALGAMCPPYAIYFAVQMVQPAWLTTTPRRILCLAAAAIVHVILYVSGFVLLKTRELGQGLVQDERDRAIDARSTRIAYIVLMLGTIQAGMVLPFNQGGWKIVNCALLAIIIAEVMRNVLIARSYRGSLRLAQ